MRSVCSQTGASGGQIGRGELGQRVDAGPQLRDALGRQRLAQLGEVQGEEREGEALRGERLRRGDADLAAAAGVERTVGLARELRAHLVADRERERAALARDPLRGDRVGRLARLRDGDRERAVVDHGIAVAELRGVLDVHGEPGPLLDQEAADHAGMARGAAGRDRRRGRCASSCSSVRPVSSTTSPPSSRSPMVSRSASGCSWISLSMNVS